MLLVSVQADIFPVVKAHITAAPPKIDGILDDPAWNQAAPADALLQREPDKGAPSTEHTEIRILRDDDQLYIGFRCFDSEPDRIIATLMRRDDDIENDDNIQIILDTYDNRRGGFFFATNPLGARRDVLLSAEGRTRNESWDCVWQSRARIDSLGWTAEMAIPLDQLRYAAGDDIQWGVNLARTIRRKTNAPS